MCKNKLPIGNCDDKEFVVLIYDSDSKATAYEKAFYNSGYGRYPHGWWRLNDDIEPYEIIGVAAWFEIPKPPKELR